ncbi:hypothetical protein [Coleofasciculus chthonoplastes]|uniref:hypothetical protein n=1 Tax=Coleofasciculus chthonoplastes TaxID=64178 RepID=UPI0012FC5993|nr:hypothetical protein [Coleofasciculus chthonoplastes]
MSRHAFPSGEGESASGWASQPKVEAEFAPLVSNPEQYNSMIGYIYRGRYQSASSAAKPRIFTSKK